MLDFLSEHLDIPKETILKSACIDPAEIEDTQAFEILGIPLPQKHEDEEFEEEKLEEAAAMLAAGGAKEGSSPINEEEAESDDNDL